MKYIRNEEGIFEELTQEEVVRYGYYDKCKYIKTKYGIRLAGNVIKESEKLDELCDVLVIEEQNVYDNGIHKYLMGNHLYLKKMDTHQKDCLLKEQSGLIKG